MKKKRNKSHAPTKAELYAERQKYSLALILLTRVCEGLISKIREFRHAAADREAEEAELRIRKIRKDIKVSVDEK